MPQASPVDCETDPYNSALRLNLGYNYDAVGNVSLIRDDTKGYRELFSYDSLNRLIAITNTLGQVTTYSYNASGQRVKRVDASGTLVTLGAHFEQLRVGTAVTNTNYYFFGDQRVAMRQTNAGTGVSTVRVAWLHGDHLGSASLTTSITGTKVAELRYFAYGETRWAWPNASATPTDRTFTGQRNEKASFAGSLMDYGARMYSPLLGRFLSADSLVPQPGDPQSLDRYSYVLGNPLKYVDSDGHFAIIPIIIGLAAVTLILSSHVRQPPGAVNPTGGELGMSVLAGDANDVAVLVTGYDWISNEPVPHFSGEWWANAGLAALPLASGSIIRVGRRFIGAIDTVSESGNVIRRIGTKLTTPMKEALRDEARDIYDAVKPGIRTADRLQIHHRIPLEWAHLFPDADPNRLSNLVALPGPGGKFSSDIHQQVSDRWTAFRDYYFKTVGREPTAQEILNYAQDIDKQFSHYYR